MVEQASIWQDSQLESSQQLITAKNFPEGKETSIIEIGTYIKHSNSPFLISEIKGEPFRLNPIRAGEAISFIYDPKRHRSRKRNANYENEITTFSTIPPGLYTMLKVDSTITPENVYERILADFGRDGLKYVVPARAYLSSIGSLGDEIESVSNSPFAISVDYRILKKKFKLEGEQFYEQFPIIGRFGEIRESSAADTILRIRKERGRPNTYDAINLGLDELAYQAILPKEKRSNEKLSLILFNLADGKKYEFNVKYNSFYVELIDSLVFSALSEKAGYVPKEEEELKFGSGMPVEKREEINIIYKTTSGNNITISAEIAHERARNCLRRMAGQLQKIDKMYDFKPINY